MPLKQIEFIQPSNSAILIDKFGLIAFRSYGEYIQCYNNPMEIDRNIDHYDEIQFGT